MENINTQDLIQRCYTLEKNRGFWNGSTNQTDSYNIVIMKLYEAYAAYRHKRFADMDKINRSIQSGENIFHSKDELLSCPYELYVLSTFEQKLTSSCIRLFDYCGRFGFDLPNYADGQIKIFVACDNFGERLFEIIKFTTSRYNGMSGDRSIAILYENILRLAKTYDVDLKTHIEMKLEYDRKIKYK